MSSYLLFISYFVCGACLICVTAGNLNSFSVSYKTPVIPKPFLLYQLKTITKVDSGETACAYWIPELIALYSFHLNDNNTIFAEKMMTITMALLWLKDYYVASEDKQNIAIFSDCLSILTASKTEHSKCGPIFMDEILRIIHDGPVSIEFIWEPGHLGTKGNEFVDTLAQDASTESDVDYDYFRTQ